MFGAGHGTWHEAASVGNGPAPVPVDLEGPYRREGERLRALVARAAEQADERGDRKGQRAVERVRLEVEAALEHRDLARARLLVRQFADGARGGLTSQQGA